MRHTPTYKLTTITGLSLKVSDLTRNMEWRKHLFDVARFT